MSQRGDRTSVFTADNVGGADPVRCWSDQVTEVLINENGFGNTTRYNIYEPFLTSGPVTKAAGIPYQFKKSFGYWNYGDIVGYIELLDVSPVDFAQEEK